MINCYYRDGEPMTDSRSNR